MKNSPHRRKHLQHKAIRAASHLDLYPLQKPLKSPTPAINNLRPLNVKRCIDILNVYKKHLERIRFYKSHHDARWSTPGQVEKGPFNKHEKNPNKITAHWQASDLERSKQIGTKNRTDRRTGKRYN